MLRRKVGTKPDLPIFSDPSGKRWRRTLLILLPVLAVVLGMTLWATALAMAPIWHVAKNQAPTYPEQVASHINGNTPNIGEGDLTRVDLVTHSSGKTYLTDPFSGKIFRQATPAEAKAIGTRTSVIEHYQYLPDNTIALTFDDGPNSQWTPEILDILERYHVPATFFVIGYNVLANPSIVTREVNDGDMVGIHTLTHVHFEQHGSVRDREEMIGDDRLIRSAAGYDTKIWRIPYTDEASPIGILTAQQLGYQEVDFDLDTHDWQYLTKTIPVPKLDGNGHVVEMHDGGPNRKQTVEFLPKLIKEAIADHYKFVTLGSLLPSTYQSQQAPATLIDQLSSAGLWFTLLGWHEILSSVMYFFLALVALMESVYVVRALLRHRRNKKRVWPEDQELPPVSVIIPARNEAKVLAATLEKLMLTEYTAELEVIAAINGSSDETEDVAKAIAEKWPILRVIVTEPGKANALNEGIKVSRHDIIVTMDADTQFMPDTISMLCRHFTDVTVGGVAGHVKVGNLKSIMSRLQAAEYLQGIAVRRLAEGVVVAPGACAAFRKQVLVEAGGYTDDTRTEDFDITVRVRRDGWRIVQENEAVAYTEVPETLKDFLSQRKRWMYGTLQSFWKHRSMLLKKRHSWLGMGVLPYHLLSMIVTATVVPLMYIGAGLSIQAGQWRSLGLFSIFALIINFVPTLAAITMTRERFVHLLIIPLASFAMNPLRAYVLYVAIVRAIKGRIMSSEWVSPQRNDSITALLPCRYLLTSGICSIRYMISTGDAA